MLSGGSVTSSSVTWDANTVPVHVSPPVKSAFGSKVKLGLAFVMAKSPPVTVRSPLTSQFRLKKKSKASWTPNHQPACHPMDGFFVAPPCVLRLNPASTIAACGDLSPAITWACRSGRSLRRRRRAAVFEVPSGLLASLILSTRHSVY